MTQADRIKAASIASLWRDVAHNGVTFMKDDLGRWRYTFMSPSLDDHIPLWMAGKPTQIEDLHIFGCNALDFAALWEQLSEEGGKLQFLRKDYDDGYWVDAQRGDAPGVHDDPSHWRVIAEAPLSLWLNLRTMEFTTKYSKAVNWQQHDKDPIQMYDQSAFQDLR